MALTAGFTGPRLLLLGWFVITGAYSVFNWPAGPVRVHHAETYGHACLCVSEDDDDDFHAVAKPRELP